MIGLVIRGTRAATGLLIRCSRGLWLVGLVGLSYPLMLGCGALEDAVFEVQIIQFRDSSTSVPESAGEVQIMLQLSEPVASAVRVDFEVRGLEAQDDCQVPDFRGVPGTLTFAPGESTGRVSVWIEDDDWAELEERLQIVVTQVSGATLVGDAVATVVIEDDDRGGIVDAADHGALPDAANDQTDAVQSALDAAGELEGGVVVLPPGSYQVAGLVLSPGSTLSARGASLVRSTASEEATPTLRVRHSEQTDSAPTLVEGLSVDGQRDLQGPFEDFERENDHLIFLDGDGGEPGRLDVAVQQVSVLNGTGDGIAVGPDVVAELCHIQAEDIWRDAIGLHGGRTDLKVRHFDATASLGTSGIYLDGYIEGYDGVRTVEVEIEEARLDTGDVELEVVDGSRVVLRRLLMAEAPFRVLAPDSVVEVSDSVIQLGVASERHNNLSFIHDVRFVRSTIYASERIDELQTSEEMDREFSTVTLLWSTEEVPEPPSGDHSLSFTDCSFALGADIDPDDTVYAISNPGPVGQVVVQSSDLADGYADWFAPGCVGCVLE